MKAVQMMNIVKVYPNGIVANKGVNFEVEEGEIHALVGENGAGKTTLMKILFGIEQPTKGEIRIFEKPVHIHSPHDAIRLGIGMVHQHFMLVPSLTVTENIVLGMEPKKGTSIDMERAIEMVKDASKKFGLEVPPTERIMDLPVGIKQRVEILKALIRGAKILILDEPTAVLTPQETEELFVALKNLAKKGMTIIFISHKLKEVKEISDRVTVLRNGKTMGTFKTDEVSEEDISRLMVGREVELVIERPPAKPDGVVLEVKNLNYFREDGVQVLKNVSFSVRSGEILGVAGVEGNGQRELVEILTGLRFGATGSIKVNGEEILGLTAHEIRKRRVAHIPEDRVEMGVALKASIAENLISDRYYKKPFSGKLTLFPRAVLDFARKAIETFAIKTDSPKTPVAMLSGGNMQKVVVAREFTSGAKLLIADQPTRGIDVGSTEFVRKKLIEVRDSGVAVLLVSADLQEILQLSDRIIVMYKGEIVGYFDKNENLTEEELGYYMLGVRHHEPERIKEALVS